MDTRKKLRNWDTGGHCHLSVPSFSDGQGLLTSDHRREYIPRGSCLNGKEEATAFSDTWIQTTGLSLYQASGQEILSSNLMFSYSGVWRGREKALLSH